MLTPLTDEQLNPMRGSAPLLVERYRQLREYITAATALAHAANDSVKLARVQIERLQKQEKEAELALAEKIKKSFDEGYLNGIRKAAEIADGYNQGGAGDPVGQVVDHLETHAEETAKDLKR